MPMKTHKVTIQQKNAVCMEFEARGLKTLVDEPLTSGGTNLGHTPVELLLGSLGTCLAITTFIFASMQGIPITDIRVEVEGDMNNDGLTGVDPSMPTGFQSIRYHFFVKSSAPEERIRQLVEFAEAKCPVGSTIRNSAAMSEVKLTMV
ncbi:OsmC family protein [Sporomusa sphaeroides DSM 2875]|uniref:OsmC family protein n=1 Tax=Sporomusa sphaeroides TaxID=47679 RepID=UPI002030BFC8|nr:OsmC family protein [Sporomusa sphaeroides]MCM0759158.1 OsmC family protein [Sporomusa sphaeroides DSM 2875]